MCMSVLSASMYVCIFSACRGKKRALDPLELEFQAVESYQMGARN